MSVSRVNEGKLFLLSLLTVLEKHLFSVPFQVWCVQVLGKSSFWVGDSKGSCSKDCSSRTLSGSEDAVFPEANWVWKTWKWEKLLKKDREEIKLTWRRVLLPFPTFWKNGRTRYWYLSDLGTANASNGSCTYVDAKILYLDEPSMKLKPIFIQEIFDIIQDIKTRTTVLLIDKKYQQGPCLHRRPQLCFGNREDRFFPEQGKELLTQKRAQGLP